MKGASLGPITRTRGEKARKMFRQLTQYFPDLTSENTTQAGREAQTHLKRALIFGALLMGITIAAPFVLSSPDIPETKTAGSPTITGSEQAPVDRTPAPADPSPVDFGSPGVILAFVLLAGGLGLAVYLRSHDGSAGASNGLFVPVAEQSIGPEQKLQLIRCTDELLLLAVSSEKIELLKSYPVDAFESSPERPEASDSFTSDGMSGSGAFASVLKRYAYQYASNHQS